MYIIMAILGFSLLIIVHELGHFIMAKANGIKVEEFSIGMGPEVFSKKGKETQYSLRLFPIGGYVKMLGEEEVSDDELLDDPSYLSAMIIFLNTKGVCSANKYQKL